MPSYQMVGKRYMKGESEVDESAGSAPWWLVLPELEAISFSSVTTPVNLTTLFVNHDVCLQLSLCCEVP